LTDQGIRNLPAERALELVGKDPDYAIRDLYNAIELGNHPSWSFYIQVMTMEEAEKFQFNPFDLTKIWPHKEYPLIPVGKIVLDRNPENYFAEVEQAAFSPSHFIPGVEASPDKMLQGRLFSYNDTHYHRLGKNYQQIPINCPYRTKVRNYERDGLFAIHHQDGAPNYHPNSFRGPEDDPKYLEHRFQVHGEAARFNSHDDEDNFTQPNVFWNKVLDEGGRQRLVDNISGHLKDAAAFIRERAVKVFTQVDPDFGRRVQAGLDEYEKQGLTAKAN
jgi:catalase